MKNQKSMFYEKWSTVFFWAILAVILSLILISIQNQQPTYTQSEVSALMKFNASEFGNSYCTGTTQNNCFGEIVKNNFCVYKKDGKLSIAIGSFGYDEKGCIGQYSPNMTVYYFPQFADVSVVVEPERQECWNVTWWVKTKCENIWDIEGRLSARCIGTENATEQKCQTIPAITKQINPWAVSENDLATEFCRAKTYQIEDYRCDKWSEVSCNEKGTACGAGCVENRIINQTKPFTRGEVVEILKDSTNIKNVLIPLQEKQKIIRCTGDDGTQKDFEVFK